MKRRKTRDRCVAEIFTPIFECSECECTLLHLTVEHRSSILMASGAPHADTAGSCFVSLRLLWEIVVIRNADRNTGKIIDD